MIYDCFPFFNELDILEIRLNTLFDTVDYFVIIEASLIKKDKKMNAKYLTVLEHLKLGFEGYRRFFYRRRRKERLICFLGNWYKY